MALPESNSIRRRLQISVTLTVATLFTLGSAGVYGYVRNQEESEFREALSQRLEILISETELEYNGEIDASFHDRATDQFEAISESRPPNRQGAPEHPDAVYYVLRNHHGETLLKSPWLEDESRLAFQRAPTRGAVEFGSTTLGDGRHARTVSTTFPLPLEKLDPDETVPENASVPPDYDADRPENQVHLIVAESDEGMRHMLTVLGMSLFAVGILITVATTLLIALLVKRACLPIGVLGSDCAKIGSENLNARLVGDRTPEELLPLVAQFNALLDRLEQAFERERRFSVDIAHELRTPIAELRSLAEVALQPSPEEEAGEDPGDVYRETALIGERIHRLIDTLSNLYRSESSAVSVRNEEVNLRNLLEESVATHRTTFGSTHREIEIEGEDAIVIQTDPALARGILDNLVGNAVTHSVPSTKLICRIARPEGAGTAFVEIGNETDRLTGEDLRHLGEPFWQKDTARSDPGHFGLGLSSVMAYVKLLKAEIQYRLEKGRFLATVTFP
ncbi:MAG: hypothetical protein KDN19_01700 [Verrucomicrobiae bacterium]|nr:hypothetical protein [Verrucomicrobiae bacterium]